MKECILFKIITRLAKEKNYFPLLAKFNINEQTIRNNIIKDIKHIEQINDAVPTYFIIYIFKNIRDHTLIDRTLYTYEFDKCINQTLYVILKPYIKQYLKSNLLTNKILDKINNYLYKKNYSFDEYYEILQKENVTILNLLRAISWHDDIFFWRAENKKFVIFILKLLINKN